MLTLKGKKVSKNWGSERIGTILDIKEVPEKIQKLQGIGNLITPPHNEFLVGFSSGATMWCTKNELRLVR